MYVSFIGLRLTKTSDEAIMWLDCNPWTVSKKEKTHRMSKVWPFIWVLSLDYDFEGIWGLSC